MTSRRRNSPIRGLYAITPDETNTAELLRKMHLVLVGGARVIQYRNKAADEVLRLEQAGALHGLTQEFSVPLIINDDAGLALRVEAEGVHLGSDDGSIAAARAVLGNDKLIGVSCYNRMALAHDAVRQRADYVAFGSFFASAVKPGAAAASLDLLRQARNEIDLPVVAIGGITLLNCTQLLEAGANALAVISAVFNAEDIQDAARQFSNLNYPETGTIR